MPTKSPLPAGEAQLEEAFITQIEIEDLYGMYSYRLGSDASAEGGSRRLFILYGDNGSGKTTVLQLVFSLLSRAQGQGHRGQVARTPFRRLSVRIGAGTEVLVTRPSDSLTGRFRVSVIERGSTALDTMIEVGQDNGVPADQPGLHAYLEALGRLNVDLYFLSDDRKGRSSVAGAREDDHDLFIYRMQQEEYSRTGRRPRTGETPIHSAQLLEIEIGRLVNWLRSQAIRGSTAGEVNTNTIYADIIKRIVRTRRGRPAASERDIATLVGELRRIEERNRAFAVYGLTSSLRLDPIIAAANAATPSTRRIIADILGPYIDGLSARLDALATIQQLLSTFVESVNSFLYNKTLSFDVRRGLRIEARNGQVLAPRALSSGERQLLLLFSNTVLARDSASIFLIDEPEISLNVKWQRKLLDALLSLTRDSPVQFIIATHSVELLARHKEAVRRLSDRSPGGQ